MFLTVLDFKNNVMNCLLADCRNVWPFHCLVIGPSNIPMADLYMQYSLIVEVKRNELEIELAY
jgi:hypothetical protein